ncbi:PREDICTED: uncharacterized protein LOC108970688 [Bactrocera latifrons]|uniref:uncharacterized protein LOC108970688 n=1 Tax=Bactrocera latifrons TaxID=174628 RepID=UPI0008DE1AE8|nr:PREDICTED: uncharacterized protein LOC108970688 [Bactrocera latifrons]
MSSKQQATPGTSLTYDVFMHLEELRRPTQQPLRLSKSKVALTTHLITENIQNIQKCSNADLKAITRELQFKEQLRKQISSLKAAAKQSPNSNPLKSA